VQPSPGPIAFLSYVHADDEGTRGGIVLLHRLLQEFVNLCGERPLEIFLDAEGMLWGRKWKNQVKSALDQTFFFVPVITPRFFESKHCRNELDYFIEREKIIGRDDLIFPIYYANCDFDNPEKLESDPLKEAIAGRNWSNWCELWLDLRDETRAVKEELLKMARQLRAASGQLKPNIQLSPPEAEERRSRGFSDGIVSDTGVDSNDRQTMLTRISRPKNITPSPQGPQAIIFTHFSLPDSKEWDEVTKDVYRYVSNQWGDYLRIVNDSTEIKLAYIFFSEAYTALISDVSDDAFVEATNREDLIRQ